MAELMLQADLAIGAGGISVWERACLGLPAIVIAIADNQVEVSQTVGEAGACLYLGEAASLSDGELATGLLVMLNNSSLRKSLSRVGLALVNGLGCEKVAREMLLEPVRVRRARAEDADKVFAWRNAAETRRYSHDPRPLSLEQHLEWFRNTLADRKRVLLVGEGENGPVGVLRYDLEPATATVSVYLNPSYHGRGLGRTLLLDGERWIRRWHPEIMRLRAHVLVENLASRRAFAKAGFVERSLQFEKSIAANVENTVAVF
jgi:RimJ/RimL family protein N-acetyltransferase